MNNDIDIDIISNFDIDAPMTATRIQQGGAEAIRKKRLITDSLANIYGQELSDQAILEQGEIVQFPNGTAFFCWRGQPLVDLTPSIIDQF